MKILIAIVSCHRDRELHSAQIFTWLEGLSKANSLRPAGIITEKFFLGNHALPGLCWPREQHEVFLDCDDSYETLPLKTQAICQWALEHDFEYMFKCDTDTVINPREFFSNMYCEMRDYLGGENADQNVPGFGTDRIEFCSGGAGYWLSRRAIQIIAETPVLPGQTAEDVFVANALLAKGIKPTFHPGYRWRPGAKIDKDVVSLHLSSALQRKYDPQMMYTAYEQIKGLK